MARKLPLIYKYLRRNKKFPTVWCGGCGNGIVLGAIIRAVDELGYSKDDIVMVSGIGCSGRMPVYVDFNTLHTTHGRALTFATGVKLANPRLKVIVVMGDGDAIAIGGNHFIHSCRRNIEIAAIVINNFIYGMTGGQFSPTTPTGDVASTCPFGNIVLPMDICELAKDSGAAYVARSTVYHIVELQKYIAHALQKPGFSVVEAMSNCYTQYGRYNQMKSQREMFNWFKENTYNMSSEELSDQKIPRGVYADREEVCYSSTYAKMAKKAMEHEVKTEVKNTKEV